MKKEVTLEKADVKQDQKIGSISLSAIIEACWKSRDVYNEIQYQGIKIILTHQG